MSNLRYKPFRKAGRSQGGGNCVEVADEVTGAAVRVRDSKDVEGPILQFTGSAWRAFVKDAPEVPAHLRVTA